MGLISVPGVTDGTVIDASDINIPVNTIVNEINGLLDTNNLADNAVTTNDITDGAVTNLKLATDSVTSDKVADGAIAYAKLLSTIFSGQITSQTNTGTGGGTMYSLNLGGIKLVWGLTNDTGAYANGTTIAKTVIYPTSFFATKPTSLCTQTPGVSALQFAYVQTSSTSSTLNLAAYNASGANATLAWFYLSIGQ